MRGWMNNKVLIENIILFCKISTLFMAYNKKYCIVWSPDKGGDVRRGIYEQVH
jgi:hypothetical protein